jgi:hypothetical protein
MDRSWNERNAASRERLERTIVGLSLADLERPSDGGWSAMVLLVHMSFWDGLVASRWRHAARTGRTTPIAIPDEAADLINESARPGWEAVEAARAAELAQAAAADVDDLIQGLPDEVVAAVVAEGRARLVDRSLHRSEHLDAIDRLSHQG